MSLELLGPEFLPTNLPLSSQQATRHPENWQY